MKEIRLLTADEVECRVATVKKDNSGCSLLLYKDARVDMRILDETFGPMNWQRHHGRDNANCIISVWDDDKKQWIEKEDTGTESNTEAAKGLASDSFKRAGFNWGIGRELYDAPFIWVQLSKQDLSTNGKITAKFFVKDIEYDRTKSEFVKLKIVDSKGVVRFDMGKKIDAPVAEHKATSPTPIEQTQPAFPDENTGPQFLMCQECTVEISQKVHDYSVQKFGRPLCMKCQKVAAK